MWSLISSDFIMWNLEIVTVLLYPSSLEVFREGYYESIDNQKIRLYAELDIF